MSLEKRPPALTRKSTRGSSPITIRNISSTPLALVLVEYIDAPKDKSDLGTSLSTSFASVTNRFGLTNSTTRRAVPQIPRNAQAYETKEAVIQLAPFTITRTDIKPWNKNPTERLRFTFQTESGEGHQMICPVPTLESASLKPLTPDASARYTGIFLPETSFIALFSSADLDSWMSHLPDNTSLGALSIPGTHNSPTWYNAAPSVRCQAVSPMDQLKNGVRFFDIRVEVPDDVRTDRLPLVHSIWSVSLSSRRFFKDLHNECLRFLEEHPTETLVMSLKREGVSKGTDKQLSKILHKFFTNSSKWFTEPRVPMLGEVRGKIVLLRRFTIDESLKSEHGGKGWGLDGDDWAKSPPDSLHPSGHLRIQDFYQVMETPTIEQKITYVLAHLDRSGCCDFRPRHRSTADAEQLPLYLNFLSASNFFKVNTWPEKIAARVNPATVEHLCRKHMISNDGSIKEGSWSTGIVIADWVGLDGDWDLVRLVVGMNAKLIHGYKQEVVVPDEEVIKMAADGPRTDTLV